MNLTFAALIEGGVRLLDSVFLCPTEGQKKKAFQSPWKVIFVVNHFIPITAACEYNDIDLQDLTGSWRITKWFD